jgi:hypothetical protein
MIYADFGLNTSAAMGLYLNINTTLSATARTFSQSAESANSASATYAAKACISLTTLVKNGDTISASVLQSNGGATTYTTVTGVTRPTISFVFL